MTVERMAALCLTGSITDLVKLQIAKALVESIETTNTLEDLEQAGDALSRAVSALEDEAEGEIKAAVQEALT